MSEPHRIVAGGCTNIPRFPRNTRPRLSEKDRVERPRPEPATEEHLARRIWRALRRALRKARLGG